MLDIANSRTMTPRAFAALGLGEMAYVRRIVVQGEHLFAIMAANGQQVGLAPDYDSAATAVHEHDLSLVSIH